MPWHFYLTSALPRLLTLALPLALLAVALDPRVRLLVAPSACFIGAMSLLAHKEWRFIVYTVPTFNLAAAVGFARLCVSSCPVLRAAAQRRMQGERPYLEGPAITCSRPRDTVDDRLGGSRLLDVAHELPRRLGPTCAALAA